jgi:MFS family permease
MWGLGATFFLIAFYQRVAPAVMASDLMGDFGLNATALGNLSALYFYSYVFMQIPTGILSDSWGPRRLLTVGAGVAGLGSLLFAVAPTIWWAYLGRFLIGGSVAVAFVATLQLAGHWLAPRQFALATGLTLLVGVLGAVFAGVPLQIFIAAYGWRTVMGVSAIFPLILAVFIWLIVRDNPQEKGYTSYLENTPSPSTQPTPNPGALSGIVAVFRYRNSLPLTIIPGGIVGCVLAFSGLWGVPFLTTHYQLPATQAAALNTTLLVAWAISGPVFGSLSDRLGRRKPLYIVGCAGAVLGWSLIIFVPNLPIWLLTLVLIGTGLASGGIVISYAFIRESVPPHLSGTAIGVCNTGNLVGPMLLQPAVGWLLDQNWRGQLLDGIRIYDLAAYQTAFLLMLGGAVLSFIMVLSTQETYCQPQVRD